MHYTDRALLADRPTCPGAGVAVFLSVARIRDSARPPKKTFSCFSCISWLKIRRYAAFKILLKLKFFGIPY